MTEMDVMNMEVFAVTKARLAELDGAELRRYFRMIEVAYRLAQLAHEDGVEMAVESPDPKDDHAQHYVLWSHQGLVLSVYIQSLRQTLADLCGR